MKFLVITGVLLGVSNIANAFSSVSDADPMTGRVRSPPHRKATPDVASKHHKDGPSFTTQSGITFRWSLINYNPANGIDGFSSIKKINECVVLLGKRTSTPDFRVARSDICANPPDPTTGVLQWDVIGNIKDYTGAHTYYFGSRTDAMGDNVTNTIISATGDTGNPCIMRSTDQGKSWNVVLNYKGSPPAALFSPIYFPNGNEWVIFWRDDPNTQFVMRSKDDGLTWTKQTDTVGLTAGPRRVQIFGDKLYYSAVFGAPSGSGLFTSSYGAAATSAKVWTGMLIGKPIFAGVTVTSKGTILAGEYMSGTKGRVFANVYRKGVNDTDFTQVLRGTANTDLMYYRQITEVVPGVIMAILSCSENSQNDKDMQIYVSTDDGFTWFQQPTLIFSEGNTTTCVNAVYGTVIMTDPVSKRKFLLAAAQPNNMVLRLDWDQ